MSLVHLSRPGRRACVAVAAALLTASALVLGCSSDPPPKITTARPKITRDVPQSLKNTLAANATIVGTEPMPVSGYGLVVGLNDTGGLPIADEGLQQSMVRMMELRGISSTAEFGGWAINGKSAQDLLRDKHTAVVLVEAAIPPGTPNQGRFDVYVTAVNATSLEGGRLWTTELVIGGPTVFGTPGSRRIAAANGPIFINPFADPKVEGDGVSRRQGRILDGGVVTDPLGLEVQLDDVSHARARVIEQSINTRFPEEPLQIDRTARGRNGQNIAITIPPSFRDRPGLFVSILKGVPVDYGQPDAYANRYVQALQAEPALSTDLGWALLGLGERAVPFVRPLYDSGESVPRMTALRVGARLRDHKAAPYLQQVAETTTGPERLEAIELLGEVDGGPSVDLALRKLVGSKELLVRVTAYETLARRAERVAKRRWTPSPSDTASPEQIMLGGAIPPGNIQGVERAVIAGRFLLDRVPMGDPLVYVTQQGRPKIVLFGEDLRLTRPLLATAWQDRLMLSAEGVSSKIRVYYRDYKTGRAVRHEIGDDMIDLVQFMAHKTTPEDPTPGLNLSYSEIVGAIYSINQQRGFKGAFASETDKLRAQILEATAAPTSRNRPDTLREQEEMLVFQPTTAEDVQDRLKGMNLEQAKPDDSGRPKIVPITRQTGPAK